MSMKMSVTARVGAIVTVLLRAGLGGLLAIAGLLKLREPSELATEIANYQLLPGIAPYLAATLPTTEILLGVGLVIFPTRWRRPAAAGALVFFLTFLIAVSSAVLRHINISCGCFGAGGDTVSPLTLGRNLSLVASAALLLYLDRPRVIPVGRPVG